MSIVSRIKTRHLQCFLEVVQHRSFAKAADSLAISQPAASKTLRELEDILGVRLLDRNRGGVSLTHHGELFYRHAGASLAELRQAIRGVVGDELSVQPTVSFGVLPNVAATVIPEALESLRRANDVFPVRILSGSNAALLASLRTGEVAFVIGRLAAPNDMKGIAFEPLYMEAMELVVRHGHPLAQSNSVELSRLSDFPLILPNPGTIIRTEAENFLIANGIGVPSDVIETIAEAFGRAMVRSSDAVWMAPYGVVANDIEDGALCRLPIDMTRTEGVVGLSTRPDSPLQPEAARLLEAIRDVTSRHSNTVS